MSSSSISSNVTSSDQDTENGSVTFETVGEWDPNRAQGPAVVVPRDIKNIVLTKYRIEWLDVSSRDENYYAKNHIVASVTFAEYFRINSTSYSSARISMELGKIWEVDSNSVDSVSSQILCLIYLDLKLTQNFQPELQARRPLLSRNLHGCAAAV